VKVNNAPSEALAVQVASTKPFDLSPQTFEQALTFANYLADSDMVPKDFKGKPGNCLVAMQWGSEIGLKPLQAMQNLAVINGRPALWGDAVIALVRGSPLCEYVNEDDDGNRATCRVKRRGEPEQVRTFSMEDAKIAGLQGKQGPWTQYPKRMRQMRARAFALRDVFPDVLRGLPVAEEIMDAPAERFMGAAEVIPPATPAAPTTYPQDQFDKNLPAWRKVIADGRKTADQIISMANSKHPLTEEQKATIKAAPPKPDAPVVTYAMVAEKLHAAADADALNVAGDLIGEVSDGEQRKELSALYDQRLNEIELQGA